MAISYISDASGAMTTVSPSFTLSAAVATGDVLILWCSGTATTPQVSTTPPTGWNHALTTGDGHPSNTASVVDCTADTMQIACLWHVVTSGENGTTSFGPLTNLYQTAPTGRTNIIALRGADTTTPILVATSSFSNTNTATPHVLAGFTAGQVTVTGGWVCASVAADGTGSYTNPTGWTARKNETTTQGRYTGTFNTTTTSGNAVSSTNITPSTGDEYASITVLVQPPVSVSASANAVTATVTVDATNPAVWLTFAEGVSTTTSTTVTGLTNGVSYDFRVAAVNANGTGPFSTIDTDTPTAGGVSASANPVTAAVTVAASNPGIGQSPPAVAALVTVAATNPTTKLSANPPAVVATVTVAANNPTTAIGALANPVTATVTVAATNPTTKLSGSASAVNAAVTVAATNPTTKLSASASAVTATVTVAATNPVASSVVVLYPTTVSGRKWLDQNGDPYLLKCMSSWALAENSASEADITTALEQAAERGFNSVQVALFGVNQEPGWHPYTNHAGDPVFTGTPFASSLGSAWLTFDYMMDEATRLGLVVVVSLFYGFGTIGCRADMNTAYTADVDNVYNFGFDVASRYAAYPNIVWSLEADVEWYYSTAPWGAQTDKYFEGIKAGEGATPRLIIAEPGLTFNAYEQWESAFTHTGGFSYFWLDANAVYEYGNAVVDQVDAVMNWTGATTYPVWDSEIPYVSNGYPGSANRQQLRERVYGTFFRGVIGMNYGSEDWWPFGYTSWTSGPYTWDTFMAGGEALDAQRAWTLIDGLVADVTWASDGGTLLTTGLGTGDTKAASGFSDTHAAVYFPSSRTIVVATTVLPGTGNVRLRWFDPTNGSYTTIAASEAQNASRSVTHPGNNSAGDGDQVLVIDLLEVTANPVTATVTVAANNPTTAIGANASAVTATVTVAASNPVAHGTATASSVTASVTVAATNAVAHGTGNASAVNAAVTVAATNPTVTRLSNASAVTATVAVAAANPTATVSASATAVTATVTVAATNAVGQTAGDGTAHPVTADVTVAANNPSATGTGNASSVTATVTVAATNPTVTRLSNASAVAASVTVAGSRNPTTRLTAGAPAVTATVAVAAANPVAQVQGDASAHPVTATVTAAATNPTVIRLSNANPAVAAVTVGASNPTTKLTATITAITAAVLVEAFNAASVRLNLRARTTSVTISSATVAATLTSSTGTSSITSSTSTEDIE